MYEKYLSKVDYVWTLFRLSRYSKLSYSATSNSVNLEVQKFLRPPKKIFMNLNIVGILNNSSEKVQIQLMRQISGSSICSKFVDFIGPVSNNLQASVCKSWQDCYYLFDLKVFVTELRVNLDILYSSTILINIWEACLTALNHSRCLHYS